MAHDSDLIISQNSLVKALEFLAFPRRPLAQSTMNSQSDDMYTQAVHQTVQEIEDQLGTTKFIRAIYDV